MVFTFFCEIIGEGSVEKLGKEGIIRMDLSFRV